MFSKRTRWEPTPNRLTRLAEEMRNAGKAYIDLTVSNPTSCGFRYPKAELAKAIGSSTIFSYRPDPKGLLSARESVTRYYSDRMLHGSEAISPERVFLQASTSEGYASVFKLLCDPGDTVLIPRPSYPLFEFLAQLNDVRLKPYPIRFDGGWHVDFDAVKKAITPTTRAIIIVNPNNPTGFGVSQADLGKFNAIASSKNLALIVDEVFRDFAVPPTAMTATNTGALTFTLNGISKMIGLPQMKLGWIVVSGPERAAAEASSRLEMICDTYLSVNTPVQAALPALLKSGATITRQITKRISANAVRLSEIFRQPSPVSILPSERSWYGLLSLPRIRSDEEWAAMLLEQHGVLAYPGYYFDIDLEGVLLVSHLVPEKTFAEGVNRMRGAI